MSAKKISQSGPGEGETKGVLTAPMLQKVPIVEQNVKPIVAEVQQVAAKTSVTGRHAVSRGTIFLAFYLWLISGAIMMSLLARFIQFFPGDRSITRTLQKQHNPLIRRLMIVISEPGFPKVGVPLTLSIAGIFWALRFRLEAIFILLTSSSNILNWIVKRLIKLCCHGIHDGMVRWMNPRSTSPLLGTIAGLTLEKSDF